METGELEMMEQNTAALKSSTTQVLKDIGFSDPEFDKGLQAAMDKDAGTVTEEPKVVTEEAKKPVKEIKIEKVDDIPDALVAKPKEEKVVEKTTEELDAERERNIAESTKGMSKKAADHFRVLEKRAHDAEVALKQKEAAAEKRYNDEVVKLKTQLQEVEQRAKTPSNNELVDSLKKQIEDLDGTLKKVALTEHPQFKAHYDGKIEAEIAVAASLVPKEFQEEVSELMKLPRSKQRNARIAEITESMDPIDQASVRASVANADRILIDKAKELSNWKQNSIFIEQQRQKEEADKAQAAKESLIQQQQNAEKAWNSTISRITSDEGLEVFRKVDGQDEWNGKVDQLVEQTRKMFSSQMSHEQLVEAAAKSVAADRYRDLFLAQRVVLRKLQEEIKGMSSSEPDVSGNGATTEGEDKDDFITAAEKGLKNAGIIR